MTQHDGEQEGPSLRSRTGASMTTEYQERFLHPGRLAAQKGPRRPPKAPSNDVTKSDHVTTSRTKNPPPASVAPKCLWRCSSATQSRLHFVGNQVAAKVENFTSVYQNDFPTWKTNKRRPFKMTDNLRVSQGLVVPVGAPEGRSQKGSVQVQEPLPFESITSYRLDYVSHPVQPRTRRQKPAFQPDMRPSEPAASSKPTATRNVRQELADKASQVVQNFKTWSLEAKIHGQVQTKESGLPTEPEFLSAATCQHAKPAPPSLQVRDRTKKRSKAWNLPRHVLTVHKEEPGEPENHLVSVDFPKAVKSQ